MPWEKSFDRSRALDCAMHEFWSSGFKQASVADICSAIPASRYGLYDEFDDKQTLYLQALDHYSETVVSEILKPMEQAGAGLVELTHYRDRLLTAKFEGKTRKGCMICLAAMEMAERDEVVASKVAAHFRRQRAAFLNCLNNDVEQLQNEPATLADMLVLAIQGASLMARSGASRRSINSKLKSAFDLIL